MAEVHYLKVSTQQFQIMRNDCKQIEVINDKDYKDGDTLILEEINDNGRNTGAWDPKLIISKVNNFKNEGYVILDVKQIKF